MTRSNAQQLLLDSETLKNQITDSALRIDSDETFEKLIQTLPKNPDIFRGLGDELVKQEKKQFALVAYNRAADLYIKSTMTLQAIVSKILEWSILKPSHAEGRVFHSFLQTQEVKNSPLQSFFAGLSYSELVSVMLRLVRIHAKKGSYITRSGDAGNAIYFIVSGHLEESTFGESVPEFTNTFIPATPLAQNDMFGDIFPLEKETFHCCYVRAVSDVELVKISKPVLKAVCYRHPRVRKLIENISRDSHIPGTKRQWKRERKSVRYNLPANVALSLLSEDNPSHNHTMSGVTKDLCKDGASISLRTDNGSVHQKSLLETDVKLEIETRNRSNPVNASGKIVWYKAFSSSHSSSAMIGIQFQEMDKKNLNTLNTFFSETNGEQDMLWDLWNDMMS